MCMMAMQKGWKGEDTVCMSAKGYNERKMLREREKNKKEEREFAYYKNSIDNIFFYKYDTEKCVCRIRIF